MKKSVDLQQTTVLSNLTTVLISWGIIGNHYVSWVSCFLGVIPFISLSRIISQTAKIEMAGESVR